MITEQDTAYAEDAVQATARIGIVDVKHGELAVPKRVLGHLLDGKVAVQLLRGGTEVAQCTAELVTNRKHTFGKLVGIDWPADIEADARVTVMCPKGSAGHDVSVLLPDPPPVMVHGRPDAWTVEEALIGEQLADAPEPVDDVKPTVNANVAAFEKVVAEALAAVVEADPAPADSQSDPAEFTVPTVLRTVPAVQPDREDDDREDSEPGWPGAADSLERTEVITAVIAPVKSETSTAADAAPVAGKLPRGWFALVVFHVVAWFASLVAAVTARVENVGQDVIDHACTVAKVIVAATAVLILAGSGVLWLLLEVAR